MKHSTSETFARVCVAVCVYLLIAVIVVETLLEW